MPHVVVPIELRWEIPQEIAAAVAVYPYRLRLVPRGEKGVWVELCVLPEGTVTYRPADSESCCHPCHCPSREATPL